MKTVPFNPSMNTPIFFTAPSSRAHRAFTTTYEGFKANFFQRETVLKLPGHRLPREDKEVDINDVLLVDKFIAEENLHQKKKGSSIRRWVNGRPQLTSRPFGSSTELLEFEDVREDDKEVREDDKTIQTVNSAPDVAICQGPLTFDPSLPLAEDKDALLAAANDQAELMRWHYRLGHLHFPKLKQLAINGKIPKKLAKVTPPKCAGCLFGAMTKLPWRGKEKKSSHLFVATKPGETVSVDQMASTEVGFFAQLKGTLTKKRYRCATIFVDHYSHLRFIHLQIDNSAVKTIAAKRAFEAFAAKHGICIQHYHCNNGQFYDNAFQQAEGVTPMIEPTVTVSTSQCSRVQTMSKKMAESTSQKNFFGTSGMHYMANKLTTAFDEPAEDLFHNQHLEIQECMRNPLAFHAKMMGDIMYFQQAMNQPDKQQFVEAVIKEVNGHVTNKHWALVKRDDVPEDVQIVPSVWSMRCKHDLTTNEIKLHKARLNLHGGKQVYGMNYYETYAPVVTWFAIQLMIVFGVMFGWALCQVNFVMADPQAPDDTDHGYLHGNAPRDPSRNWELQGSRPQAPKESIWTEASRKGLELVPCGQAHFIGLHAFFNQ